MGMALISRMAKPKNHLIGIDFSIAAVDWPTIIYNDKQLTLEYENWNQGTSLITFEDVYSFRLNDPTYSKLDIDDDIGFEISNSEWLDRLHAQKLIKPSDDFKHYLLCFYDHDRFEVICKNMVHQAV